MCSSRATPPTRRTSRGSATRGSTSRSSGNGAYDPWHGNHANPEEVWQMFLDSGARYLVPVHWDTFRLGREPLGDAMRRLTAAAGPDANRIVIDEIGGEWVMPLDEGRAQP